MNLKIKWPRISVPNFVTDLEHLARQLGVSEQIEEGLVEDQAQKLAGGSLLAWQLKLIARICLRAVEIKAVQESKP